MNPTIAAASVLAAALAAVQTAVNSVIGQSNVLDQPVGSPGIQDIQKPWN